MRERVNRGVSARVDAQLAWRHGEVDKQLKAMETTVAALQRMMLESSSNIGDRLTALETAVNEQRQHQR
jgi:Skp family chaperone for outer membrane proteins